MKEKEKRKRGRKGIDKTSFMMLVGVIVSHIVVRWMFANPVTVHFLLPYGVAIVFAGLSTGIVLRSKLWSPKILSSVLLAAILMNSAGAYFVWREYLGNRTEETFLRFVLFAREDFLRNDFIIMLILTLAVFGVIFAKRAWGQKEEEAAASSSESDSSFQVPPRLTQEWETGDADTGEQDQSKARKG